MGIITFNNALNFLFPPVCGICNKYSNAYICKDCERYVKTFEKDVCTKYHNSAIKGHFWMFKYEDIIRAKIIDYKFNEKSYLFRMFSQLILNSDSAKKFLSQMDYIIPVPIHKKRQKERGYNQCSLISRKVCRELNVQILEGVLAKSKNIVAQSTLNKTQRMLNIVGSYSIKKTRSLVGKNVVIFDDIYTTGSTINECANTIKLLGCSNIYAFTIAKD